MNDDILNDNVNYLKKISELEKILKKEQAKENENIENEEFNQKINAMKLEQQKEINKLNQKISELQPLQPNNTNNIKDITISKIEKNIIKKLNDYYEESNKNIEGKISSICSKLMQEKCNDLDNCLNKRNEIDQNIKQIKKNLNNKEIVNKIEGEDNELNELNKNNENKYKDSNKKLNDLKKKNSNDLLSNNNNDNNREVNSNDKNDKDATLSNKNVRASYQKRIIKKSRKDIQGNNNNDEENKSINFNQNNYNQNKINDDEAREVQKKGTKGKYNKNEEINNDEGNVAEEGEDGIGINKIKNMNISQKKQKTEVYGRKDNNINTTGGFKNSIKKITDQEKPLIYNEEIRELPPPQAQQNDQLQKMKYKTAVVKPRKLYTSMKKFFFKDFEQKYIKIQKINDLEKEEIEKELVNEMQRGDNNLKSFCINYIEENVLPIFKRRNLKESEREILKYNVETIAQCCGLGKNYYRDDFYPQLIKKKVVDREKSVEALKKFRMEFHIKKEDFSDEGIINKLEENNLDIYKTFQKIFGV